MAQVRCPNCGGYRVTVTTSHFNTATGATYSPEFVGCFGGILAVLAIGIGIVFVFNAIFEYEYVLAGLSVGWVLALVRIGIALVGVLIAIFGVKMLKYINRGDYDSDVVERRIYTCDICGKQWGS